MHVCSVAQLCLTLCNSMDYSLPVSSVHGTSQARILEWSIYDAYFKIADLYSYILNYFPLMYFHRHKCKSCTVDRTKSIDSFNVSSAYFQWADIVHIFTFHIITHREIKTKFVQDLLNYIPPKLRLKPRYSYKSATFPLNYKHNS